MIGVSGGPQLQRAADKETYLLFYQRIVPLNDQAHANVCMKPLNNFKYAMRTNSVPILAGEFAECARNYPIVFATGEGGLVPVALLGLREGENLFVNPDGKWAVPYVPAFVRRYPFVAARDGNGQTVVCFDESASCFGHSEGEPLFADGKPGQALAHAIQFLNEFQAGALHTEALATRLGAARLLREADSLAQLRSGQQFRLSGLQVIDESKLAGLSDAEVVDLYRSGALQLAHLHLQSLGNLGVLVDRLSARAGLKGKLVTGAKH